MKVDAVIYVDDGCTEDNLMFRGAFVPDEMWKRLSSVRALNEIVFAIPHGYAGKLPEGAKSFTRNERDDISFWKRLFSETGAEHVVRIPADSPFLDASIVNEMIDLHLKYLSEYTYSENLPQGFSCEIMGRELVESIPQSLEKMLPLGEVVRSNINQFDVENNPRYAVNRYAHLVSPLESARQADNGKYCRNDRGYTPIRKNP